MRAYDEAMAHVTVTPAQIDSIASQFEILSRLSDALSIGASDRQRRIRATDRLLELVQRLRPRRLGRTDRPPPVGDETAVDAAETGVDAASVGKQVSRSARAKKSTKRYSPVSKRK
jgi:hypothetical protein